MKTKLLLTLILCTCLSNAQTKKWTLKECVAYALENNITIQKSELEIEAAKIDVSTSKGNFLPNLNANVNHSWRTGLNTDPITNTNVVATTQSTGFGLSSNITLYDGMRNIKQLHKSNLNLLSKQYQLDDMKDNISLNVCNAFLQILFNKESLKALKIQQELSVKEVERTKELVKAGRKPKGDILEIEATLADQEKAIVNMENNILISKLSLFNLLVLKDFDAFDIADDTYELIPTDITSNSPQAIYKQSLTVRNDIKLSEVAIEIAENDIKISKGAYQPTLSGSYGFNTSYFTSELFNSPDFKTQIDSNKGHSFGLSLSIPIFNRFQTKNAVKKSRLQLEQAQLNLKQTQFDLRDKVYQAFNDTKGALKTYEASIKALEARTLAYDYATEKFNVGALDSFTFNQSKTSYINAETDVIKAKYDYIFKLKVLEFYFGVPINL
ncbi:TolC family protein [Wenyingzhuangia aestuarii]|uniref:TolC family protein n=1 Tax=Wenyingzhuangia aestuarii TaxID=1647582 RepID=UPI001439ACA6|nr:TolC family protein [Wenyingzhuangia aestuarii]NJB83853.1 outer membrane protein [Wenyingzhuangia aestuarii]